MADSERGQVVPVGMFRAECVCGWFQMHTTRARAQADLDWHTAEWHNNGTRYLKVEGEASDG